MLKQFTEKKLPGLAIFGWVLNTTILTVFAALRGNGASQAYAIGCLVISLLIIFANIYLLTKTRGKLLFILCMLPLLYNVVALVDWWIKYY